MPETVLILGSTSGIAKALCHVLAARGCRLILAARRPEELAAQASDLHIRHQSEVFTEAFDALDYDGHAAFFQRCVDRAGGDLSGVILCHGYLISQSVAAIEFSEAQRLIDVNLTSAVSLLNLAANYFEPRRTGYVVGLSSVAGDRGRQSNYIYGAAKAGLSVYLQGLRNRLYHSGVPVLTVKPGFVDTPMTHGLVNPKSPLVAQPEKVARDIDRAIRRRANVLYTPWFWWYILTIVWAIPEWLFKRLRM